jgi:hypothetical protein
MPEEDPFKDADMEPTKVPLKGPNVKSTLDTPPSPDALRAQDAVVRKHLKQNPEQRDGPGA